MDSRLLFRSSLFSTLLFFITTTISAGAKDPDHPLPRWPRKEKVTRLRFYWHGEWQEPHQHHHRATPLTPPPDTAAYPDDRQPPDRGAGVDV
ncbi:unnamed protein product [Victoria cruziana]